MTTLLSRRSISLCYSFLGLRLLREPPNYLCVGVIFGVETAQLVVTPSYVSNCNRQMTIILYRISLLLCSWLLRTVLYHSVLNCDKLLSDYIQGITSWSLTADAHIDRPQVFAVELFRSSNVHSCTVPTSSAPTPVWRSQITVTG